MPFLSKKTVSLLLLLYRQCKFCLQFCLRKPADVEVHSALTKLLQAKFRQRLGSFNQRVILYQEYHQRCCSKVRGSHIPNPFKRRGLTHLEYVSTTWNLTITTTFSSCVLFARTHCHTCHYTFNLHTAYTACVSAHSREDGTDAFPPCMQWTQNELRPGGDVFSFGILLYCMVSGCLPYHDLSLVEIYFGVGIHRMRPELPENTPIELRTLTEVCWSFEIAERPTFTSICQQLKRMIKDATTNTSKQD